MKIALEIDNKVLAEVFAQAHCRYWCSDFEWNGKTGFVLEHNEENDKKPNRHILNQKSIRTGITLLATHFGWLFGKLLANELDGPMSDVVLQFCAGLTWTNPATGRVMAKYG